MILADTKRYEGFRQVHDIHKYFDVAQFALYAALVTIVSVFLVLDLIKGHSKFISFLTTIVAR